MALRTYPYRYTDPMPSYRDTFPEHTLVDAVRADLDLSEEEWARLHAAATPYQRRVAKLLVDPTAAPHGQPGTYSNWGCRCAPCSTAYTASRRTQRAVDDFVPLTPDDLPDQIRLIKDMVSLGQPITAKAQKLLDDWDATHVI